MFQKLKSLFVKNKIGVEGSFTTPMTVKPTKSRFIFWKNGEEEAPSKFVFNEPQTMATYFLKNVNPKDKTDLVKVANSKKDFNEHKTRLQNQWQNPWQSINSGTGTAHLSSFMYQNVNYPECAILAQDPLFKKIFDILTIEPLSKGGKVIIRNGNDKDVEILEEQAKLFKVNYIIKKAYKSALTFGGCLLYIDCGIDKKLSEELTDKDLENFKGFTVIDPMNIAAINVNTYAPAAEDYMNPTKWFILGLGTVDSSRVIKFTANEPERLLKPVCMYLGFPLTQILKANIANFSLASQGLANMINKMRTIFLKTNLEEYASDGGVQLKNRINIAEQEGNNLKVFPMDVNEELGQITTPLNGMQEATEFFLRLIGVITGINSEKLEGKTATGLNNTGEGSRANFYDAMIAIQDNDYKPRLIEMYKILGRAKAMDAEKIIKKIDYDFTQMEEPDAKEIAEVISINLDSAKKMQELGADVKSVFEWLKLNPINNLSNIKIDFDEEPEEEGNTNEPNPDDVKNIKEKLKGVK